MTDALIEAQEATVAEIAAHEDPVERYHAAREARAQNRDNFDHRLQEIQKAVIRELRPGRTWAQVGDLIGASGSWAEALVSDRKKNRRESGHAIQPTPNARAAEGQHPDTTTP